MPPTITKNKGIKHGAECIAGTRIPARYVRALSEAGVPMTKIKSNHYPELSINQIREVLSFYS